MDEWRVKVVVEYGEWRVKVVVEDGEWRMGG